MPHIRSRRRRLAQAASLAAILVASAGPAYAAAVNALLVAFNGTNGDAPQGALVADASGNLYGTAQAGGSANKGTVFKLTKPTSAGAAWKMTTLLTFTGANGAQPVASLVFDKAGNLYGTALSGGSGYGLVFELSPPKPGKLAWKQTILLTFTSANGANPQGGLIFDASGNLYGTTILGGPGTANAGTVFRLSPPAAGKTVWTQATLTTFDGGTGGARPAGNLVFDSDGNLYGTTVAGGSGDGTVFQLTPPAGSIPPWNLNTIFQFDGTNGNAPYAGPLIDSGGNLYGTTAAGGKSGDGLVYRLNKPAAGKTAWTETVLTDFSGKDGVYPFAALSAAGGFLYGVTQNGGKDGNGIVFRLSPPSSGNGAWRETVLTSLTGKYGAAPDAALYIDASGDLFGTTEASGKFGYGTVFEVTP
jgi:uncharacterized repeat protein (TIGR03803 family)